MHFRYFGQSLRAQTRRENGLQSMSFGTLSTPTEGQCPYQFHGRISSTFMICISGHETCNICSGIYVIHQSIISSITSAVLVGVHSSLKAGVVVQSTGTPHNSCYWNQFVWTNCHQHVTAYTCTGNPISLRTNMLICMLIHLFQWDIC